MEMLRLRGALQSLELDIPLESLVVVTSADMRLAERLAFGVIAAAGQRQMAPLLAPTWLPCAGSLANAEAGQVEGLRPTFVFRHDEAVWPAQSRVADVLGLTAPILQLMGCARLRSCEVCAGEGRRATVNVQSLVVDGTRSLAEGAIVSWNQKNPQFYAGVLDSLASSIGLDLDSPWDSLGEAMQTVVLYGAPESNYKGVVYDVERRLAKSAAGRGHDSLATLTQFIQWEACEACEGMGLDSRSLQASNGEVTLAAALRTPVGEILSLLQPAVAAQSAGWAGPAATVIQMVEKLGLGDLAIGAWTSELEPTEAHRLRLVQVLGSGLRRALFVLQDPTRDLVESEIASVLEVLAARVSAGDSLLLVASDERVVEAADWEIELGEGGGAQPPKLISQGPSSSSE